MYAVQCANRVGTLSHSNIRKAAEGQAASWFLRVLLLRLADPEDVTVGMPDVHLTDAPGLIRRRYGDLQALLQAIPMHLDDPDRHPDALVAVMVPRRRMLALAAAALAVLAQEEGEPA